MTPTDKIKMLEEEIKKSIILCNFLAFHHTNQKETLVVLKQKLKEEKDKLEKKHE